MRLILKANQEKNIEFGPDSESGEGLFKEGNIKQKQHDQQKSIGYDNFNINIFNVDFSIFDTSHNPVAFFNWYAKNKAIIPETILPINIQMLGLGLGVVKGTITAAPNQPAERFINRSEIVNSQTGSIFSNWVNLTEKFNQVNLCL